MIMISYVETLVHYGENLDMDISDTLWLSEYAKNEIECFVLNKFPWIKDPCFEIDFLTLFRPGGVFRDPPKGFCL